MRSKLIIRLATLFVCFLLILSGGAVFASWSYYLLPVSDINQSVPTTLLPFKYKPEEILPGDQEATDLHINHFNIIDSIVNHITYGLNATKKPIVRELLEDGAGVVYGNQNVQGGNLKHMLINTSDVDALMFVVEYVTDTEYNAYTFLNSEIKSENVGKYIEVYKTVIEKGDRWVATTSFKGKAMVFDPAITSYSIQVNTWEFVPSTTTNS